MALFAGDQRAVFLEESLRLFWQDSVGGNTES